MKPSTPTKITRTKARNAALLNQLATPGLGSLIGRRWIAGSGQLLLAVIGFSLVMLWFGQMMISYYGQMFGNGSEHPSPGLSNLLRGIVIFVAAWLWSLVTSFSLLREASRVSLESLESFATHQIKMDEANVILALGNLPQWQRNGQVIARTFQFASFVPAMKFVNQVAHLAEQAQHHPDIDVRWNKVTLALTTHDAGGLTEKDFSLAKQFDALAGK